ncbi:small ribosomal subunit protein mS42 [Trichomonascus vanleenenianus]|uniref:mitochondrial 37S ribosomal protein mS42 RSM26 n=1 Tax=Trichomonascus vanleenenianus TaxID=2268995 RepID=UPI003EC9B7FA
MSWMCDEVGGGAGHERHLGHEIFNLRLWISLVGSCSVGSLDLESQMFRQGVRIAGRGFRGIHTVPRLAKEEVYRVQGINGLYSAQGFNTAWTEYQEHLTGRLTELTVETENETRTPFQVLQNTAKKSDQAHVFNYASQAYNNHFYFEALTEPSKNSTAPSLALKKKIEEQFGSVEELRDQMLHAADSMLGVGWVFLVEDESKQLHVLSRFNAGTPFEYSRSQMFNLNFKVDEETTQALEELQNLVLAKEKNYVVPLLAVSTWPQTFITDFSVAGKADFLTKWWDSINWDVVNSRYYLN